MPTRIRRPLLGLAVFKAVFFPTLAVGSIVFFALALERVLRLVQIVSRQGASPNEVWALIGFLIPHYLGLAVSAGFFFGVFLGIRHLHERSELVIIRSLGIPLRRLFIPVGLLAVLLTAFLFALTSWIQPHARFEFRDRMNDVLSSHVLGNLEEGAFLTLGSGTLMRVQSLGPEGRAFSGFFMSRNVEPGVRDFLTAARAEVSEEPPPQEGTLNLTLFDGILLTETDTEGQKTLSRQVDFVEMPVAIPIDSLVAEPGPRGTDMREFTSIELLQPEAPAGLAAFQPAARQAELHWRIVQSLALPLLGALAFPLALFGQGRSAKAGGLAIGLTLLIFFEKTARFGKLMVEGDQISPWIGLWIPLLGLFVMAALAYRFFSGDMPFPPPQEAVRIPPTETCLATETS